MGPIQLFVGIAFGNNVLQNDMTTYGSGYSVVGTFTLLGMYSKLVITVNDKDSDLGAGNTILTYEFFASH